MRVTPLAVTSLLLVLTLVPLAPTSAAATITPVVKEMKAGYGPESWKDEPTPVGDALAGAGAPALPLGYTGVYRNPYATRPHGAPVANYWGYNLTLVVEIRDEAGKPVAPTAGQYLIDARINGPAGVGIIPAKLKKLSASLFEAQFDLDGERTAPGAKYAGGLVAAGDVPFTLDVYLQPPEPLAVRQKVGSSTSRFTVSPALVNIQGVPFPTSELPEYDELSGQNTTLFHPTLIKPNANLEAVFAFGVPNAKAQIVAGANRDRKVLAEGPTDAEGRLAARFQPTTVLGAATSGLVVLEGHLVGTTNATVGNALVLLPVSDHVVNLTAVSYTARGANGREIEPLGTVAFTAVDRDAAASPQTSSRQGTLVLLKGDTVFATAQFAPPLPSAPSTRNATVQTSVIKAARSPNPYTALAVFTGNDNRFYGFASMNRGYDVTLEPPSELNPLQQGVLRVVVRNFNNNFDSKDDAGLSATVSINITGLPGGKRYEDQVIVPEGQDATVEVQFVSDLAQELTLRVNTTLGELAVKREVVVAVTPPPGPLETLIKRLPAPSPLVLVALAALVAVALRRR